MAKHGLTFEAFDQGIRTQVQKRNIAVRASELEQMINQFWSEAYNKAKVDFVKYAKRLETHGILGRDVSDRRRGGRDVGND